jgi:hypothetical protein
MRLGIALIALAFGAAACSTGGGGGPTNGDGSRPASSTPGGGSPQPSQSGQPAGSAPRDLIDGILADAASRTGLAAESLSVDARHVVWNDGSLGCPEPGMSYIQVLTPGWHVLVRAGSRTLDYRASERGSFRLCESPRRTSPSVPTA